MAAEDVNWLWEEREGNRANDGWVQVRRFANTTVLAGTGVGGGSLIYGNAYSVPPKNVFDTGWPQEITFDELRPYYESSGQMVGVEKVPDNQEWDRTRLLREAMLQLGEGARFSKLDLSIGFVTNWYDPHFNPLGLEFMPFPNGPDESNVRSLPAGEWDSFIGCIHRGDCSLGCPVQAKKTLDRNYLAEINVAEQRVVRDVRPIRNGYLVTFENVARRELATESARIVVLAAGSLGSTELLLRCRENGGLPRLSSRLGNGWSPNGFMFFPCFSKTKKLFPNVGPHTTCSLNFLDGSFGGRAFSIEDGGFPRVLVKKLFKWLETAQPIDEWTKSAIQSSRAAFGKEKSEWIDDGQGELLTNVLPLITQGVDPSNGRISLRNGQLELDWDLKGSHELLQAVIPIIQKICDTTKGEYLIPFAASPPKHIVTFHPLGGCPMGNSPQEGVVDHKGEVHGYKGLYVADGSIVPRALGFPPSRTISALGERTGDMIVAELGAAGGVRGTQSSAAREQSLEYREIIVTGHALEGTAVSNFRKGQTYRLHFRVDAPVAENVASGNIAVTGIPKGGLNTRWVVTSVNLEFVPEMATCRVEKVGATWRAEFDLSIPESGPSETKEIAIRGSAGPGNLLVTIYTVQDNGCRELYREVAVNLAGAPAVASDEIVKSPQHTHLRTTHEWTTPPEHIQASFNNGLADVCTKRPRLEVYEFVERFSATDTHLKSAIDNVRNSLESFREIHEPYLEDLDDADMRTRLSSWSWRPSEKGNGWRPLPDQADSDHRKAFTQVQQGAEWRALASDGYALFDRCFPRGTQLRALLEKLLPGSRIDLHWGEQSGPGWVSHVPWALMYMDPVDVTGKTPADPEKFLGFRFRIGTRSWRVNNGSVVLGGPNVAHSLNILYWGRKPGDDVAVEAQWQAQEYASSEFSRLLPDPTAADWKQQVVLAMDAPGPSPVAVVYFYCHCSVGDGAQPCLRFGSTSKHEDTIGRNDLSQRSIPDGPLVFANACTTAQADPHMTSELEQAFFQRGVRAFIGTETKVPIRLASKFAWLYFQFFYRRVDSAPMPAGEALTQARMFLWTQYRSVGGLFYSMSNQYDLYFASQEEVLSLR
jgi:cholesterol oxidase